MSLKRIFVLKRLRTTLATKWLFAGMHRLMLLQSDFGLEALSTLIATVRPVRRMGRIVLVQIRLQGEGLEANPADMRSLIDVY